MREYDLDDSLQERAPPGGPVIPTVDPPRRLPPGSQPGSSTDPPTPQPGSSALPPMLELDRGRTREVGKTHDPIRDKNSTQDDLPSYDSKGMALPDTYAPAGLQQRIPLDLDTTEST